MRKTTCSVQSEEICSDCKIKEELKCRFNQKDLFFFMGSAFIFMIPAVIGVILSSYGWWLIGWFAFWFIFFEFWEIRILCSHCPFYAEDVKTIHCIANYGSVKLWKYHPEPMNKSEKIQLMIGFLIFGGYPLLFMMIGGQWVWFIISLAAVGFFFFRLIITTCNKCVNFSCPLNRVPKNLVDEYLKQNPAMREDWEKVGYKLD